MRISKVDKVSVAGWVGQPVFKRVNQKSLNLKDINLRVFTFNASLRI